MGKLGHKLFGSGSVLQKITGTSILPVKTVGNVVGGIFGAKDLGTQVTNLDKMVWNKIADIADKNTPYAKGQPLHTSDRATFMKDPKYSPKTDKEKSDAIILGDAVIAQPKKPGAPIGIIGGGVAGFFVGGPIGAVVGAVAGLFLTKKK